MQDDLRDTLQKIAIIYDKLDEQLDELNGAIGYCLTLMDKEEENNDEELFEQFKAFMAKKTVKKTPRKRKAVKKKPVVKQDDEDDFVMNKSKTPEALRPRPNTVIETDEDPFKDIPLDLPQGAELINDNVKPSQRRPPHKLTTIKCTGCNKDDKVDSILVKDNYLCNSCLTGRARRGG